MLKTRTNRQFSEGDILGAFSNLDIWVRHVEMICNVNKATRDNNGYIVSSSIAKDLYEQFYQYRLERVSRTEVNRINLLGSGEEVVSGLAVQQFVDNVKTKRNHRLFGTTNREIWYEGDIDKSLAKVDNIWTAIEAKTELLKADHGKWPWGTIGRRAHFFIVVDDFDQAEKYRLIEPEIDETDPSNTIVIKDRAHYIDWRNDLSISSGTRGEIEDREIVVDRDYGRVRDHTEFTKTRA